MYTVTTGGYKKLLKRCYDVKSPLFVYGAPGIGKSEIPRQIFSTIAENTDKVFVEWNNATKEEKETMIENPGDYFVFCDQRVAQMDVTDLRGIPNMINSEMLETIPLSWVIYFTQKDANGCIFFDELNLAAPIVAGTAYQIINDREIADRRLGDNVFVFGAGNRSCDQAHVHDMPFPLRDRFNECEITPSVSEWTQDFGAKYVNPHLVSFVNWKESYFYKVNEDSSNKNTTPRAITRASKLIGDEDITSNDVYEMVAISAGEAFAIEFQAYCKHFKALDWDKIFKDPKSIKDLSIDQTWAVIGGLAEIFSKGVNQDKFNKIIEITRNFKSEDFTIVCLRMMADYNMNMFTKKLAEYPEIIDLGEKYLKFLKV